MRLSMWIFHDQLKEFHPDTHVQNDSFRINTVRLYSPDLEQNENTLYIGREQDFFDNDKDSVICVNGPDMICLDTADISRVMNIILTTLEVFARWNTTMLKLLNNNAMTQQMLNASSHLFQRPVFLLDQSQNLLAHSRNFKIGDVNEQWDAMLSGRNSRLHYLKQINEKNPQRFSYTGIFRSCSESGCGCLYEYNFFFRHSWIGTAAIIDQSDSMTRGEVDCFEILCHYLERWFKIHMQEQHSLILQFQLQSVVTDSKADTSELRSRLLEKGWKETDTLIFIKLDTVQQTYNINQFLCRTLSFEFPDICAVSVGLSVCLLCNLSFCSLEKLKNSLIPILKESGYYGTVGQTFTLKDCIFQCWHYIDLTSGYCNRETGVLYESAEYSLLYLMSEMKEKISDSVLHPALTRLAEYDRIHNTEFYNTLFVYLKNERSPLATAKEMNLHRNTLAYRLRRLQELVSDDLNDPMVRFHLILSFELKRLHS